MNTIVVGLVAGDEAKGKVCDYLMPQHMAAVRYSGGPNTGATVMRRDLEGKEQKHKLHHLPVSILRSFPYQTFLAAGVLINVDKLLKELSDIRKMFNFHLSIDPHCNIITEEHIMIDGQKEAQGKGVGSTKNGISPCCVSKYGRTAVRAESIPELDLYLSDSSVSEELNKLISQGQPILFEGSQGTLLDIDHGLDYPNVSTTSNVAGAACASAGVGPTHITNVVGVFKAYTTKVGQGLFPTKITDTVLSDELVRLGNEYGTTCLPAGEPVLTSKGYLSVEDVKVGHQVITHLGRVRKVIETSKHKKDTIYKVTLENGLSLKTNGKHPYLITKGYDTEWVDAQNLKVGYNVVTHSGKEIWKPIAGINFPNYEISSWGRIKNITTRRLLKPMSHGKWGHLKITLRNNALGPDRSSGGTKDFILHRLVANTFLEPSEYPEVRHLNGIPWDNTVENLAWGTAKDNRLDAVKHGMMSRRRPGSHGGFKQTKLTKEDVKVIRETPRRNARGWYRKITPLGISDKTLAQKYGVTRECIRDIRLGKRWGPENSNMLSEKKALFGTSKVVAIEVLPEEEVYGLTIEEDESHVTGGIVTHNTGRKRDVGWLDLPLLRKACMINGCTELAMMKFDVLQDLGMCKVFDGYKYIDITTKHWGEIVQIVERFTGVKVKYISTSPFTEDMFER